ncbi:hypothetical protein D3C73_1270300 [compost metagenome]
MRPLGEQARENRPARVSVLQLGQAFVELRGQAQRVDIEMGQDAMHVAAGLFNQPAQHVFDGNFVMVAGQRQAGGAFKCGRASGVQACEQGFQFHQHHCKGLSEICVDSGSIGRKIWS